MSVIRTLVNGTFPVFVTRVENCTFCPHGASCGPDFTTAICGCGVAAGAVAVRHTCCWAYCPPGAAHFQNVADLACAAYEETDRELLRPPGLQSPDQFLDRIGKPLRMLQAPIESIRDRDVVQQLVPGVGHFDTELNPFTHCRGRRTRDVESQRRLRNLRIDGRVGLQTIGAGRLKCVADGSTGGRAYVDLDHLRALGRQLTESPLRSIAEHLGWRIAADELQIGRQHILAPQHHARGCRPDCAPRYGRRASRQRHWSAGRCAQGQPRCTPGDRRVAFTQFRARAHHCSDPPVE